MSKPYKVVSDIFELVGTHIHIANSDTGSKFEHNINQFTLRDDNKSFKAKYIVYNDKKIYLNCFEQCTPDNKQIKPIGNPTEYFEKHFLHFSLNDLRNVLYMLLPYSTSYNGKSSINTLEHVKFTIQYIENEIKSQKNNKYWSKIADMYNINDSKGAKLSQQNKVVNRDDVSTPTKREPLSKELQNKSLVLDCEGLPAPTMRDQNIRFNRFDQTIADKYNNIGQVTGNKGQYYAVNWDDVPDPIRRDQHDKYDRD